MLQLCDLLACRIVDADARELVRTITRGIAPGHIRVPLLRLLPDPNEAVHLVVDPADVDRLPVVSAVVLEVPDMLRLRQRRPQLRERQVVEVRRAGEQERLVRRVRVLLPEQPLGAAAVCLDAPAPPPQLRLRQSVDRGEPLLLSRPLDARRRFHRIICIPIPRKEHRSKTVFALHGFVPQVLELVIAVRR